LTFLFFGFCKRKEWKGWFGSFSPLGTTFGATGTFTSFFTIALGRDVVTRATVDVGRTVVVGHRESAKVSSHTIGQSGSLDPGKHSAFVVTGNSVVVALVVVVLTVVVVVGRFSKTRTSIDGFASGHCGPTSPGRQGGCVGSSVVVIARAVVDFTFIIFFFFFFGLSPQRKAWNGWLQSKSSLFLAVVGVFLVVVVVVGSTSATTG